MKTRTILLSITVLSAVAAIYFMISDDGNSDTPQSAMEQLSAPGPQVAGSTESARSSDGPAAEIDIEKEIRADLDHLSLPEEIERGNADLEQDLAQGYPEAADNLWTISSVIPADAVVLDEKIQTKEPVSVDAGKAASVAAGDVIPLPLPGTTGYLAVVDRVSVSSSGETSWSGYLQGYNSDYPVVFTIGAQSSFATITTPEGQYAMEAVNGNGWVYKTPDLIDLVDPDQPDHLITDGNGHIE